MQQQVCDVVDARDHVLAEVFLGRQDQQVSAHAVGERQIAASGRRLHQHPDDLLESQVLGVHGDRGVPPDVGALQLVPAGLDLDPRQFLELVDSGLQLRLFVPYLGDALVKQSQGLGNLGGGRPARPLLDRLGHCDVGEQGDGQSDREILRHGTSPCARYAACKRTAPPRRYVIVSDYRPVA